MALEIEKAGSKTLTGFSYRYFLEKTSNLICNLLVAEGNAKSRLRENELLITYILVLNIPVKLKEKQQNIMALLSRKDALIFEDKIIVSSFQNSISSMRNSTASKIIKQINALYFETKCFGNDVNVT